MCICGHSTGTFTDQRGAEPSFADNSGQARTAAPLNGFRSDPMDGAQARKMILFMGALVEEGSKDCHQRAATTRRRRYNSWNCVPRCRCGWNNIIDLFNVFGAIIKKPVTVGTSRPSAVRPDDDTASGAGGRASCQLPR